MNHEPIKRHKALQPLTRHHHHALVLAQELIKQTEPIEKIRSDTISYWKNGGQEHFREEEEHLLPEYAKYQSLDVPAIHEMLMEHIKIRALADQISAGVDKEAMITLGELLRTHVHKEEHIVFPMIEKGIPEEVLITLEPWFSEHLSSSVHYQSHSSSHPATSHAQT